MTAAATARVATVRPAPHREPPFDDELARPLLRLVQSRDAVLPFPVATPLPPLPTARPAELPDPARWVRRLLLGLTEAAAGRRPLHQVAGLLAPSVLRDLGADLERAATHRGRHWLHSAAVRTVHVSEPAAGVAELAVTLRAGPRVRAMAVRLEARHGRWWCTRLQMA